MNLHSKAVELGRPIRVTIVDADQACRTSLQRWIESTKELMLLGTHEDTTTDVDSVLKGGPSVIIFGVTDAVVSSTNAIQSFKQYAPHSRLLVLLKARDAQVVSEFLLAGADGLCDREDCATHPQDILAGIVELLSNGNPLSHRIRSVLVEGIRKTHPNHGEQSTLTTREMQIIDLWSAGLTDKEVASRLVVSFETVKSHAKNILRKLKAHNRIEACRKLWNRDKSAPVVVPMRHFAKPAWGGQQRVGLSF